MEDVGGGGEWVLFKGLFTRREGYPSTHIFPFFPFVVFTRKPGLPGYVGYPICVLGLPWQAG